MSGYELHNVVRNSYFLVDFTIYIEIYLLHNLLHNWTSRLYIYLHWITWIIYFSCAQYLKAGNGFIWKHSFVWKRIWSGSIWQNGISNVHLFPWYGSFFFKHKIGRNKYFVNIIHFERIFFCKCCLATCKCTP